MISGKVQSNLLWSFLGVWINRLGGLIIFWLMARALSPEEFGVYATIWAIILLVEVFSEQGFTEALIQIEKESSSVINSVFVINLVSSIAIAALLFFNSHLISVLLKMPELEGPLQLSILALIFNALGFTQLAEFKRHFKYKLLAQRSLLSTLISGTLGVFLALNGFGVWALTTQFVTASLINMLFLWVYSEWKFRLDFDFSGAKKLMGFSLYIMCSRLLDAVNTRVFEISIAFLKGPAVFGNYSISSRLSQITSQLLNNSITDIGLSTFSTIQKNTTKLSEGYINACKLTLLIIVPIYFLLASVSPVVIKILFGEKWVGSANIFTYLLFLGASQSIQFIGSAVLKSLGKSREVLFLSLSKALIATFVLVIFRDHDLFEMIVIFVAMQVTINNAVTIYFLLKFLKLELVKILNALTPLIAINLSTYLISSWISGHVTLSNPYLFISTSSFIYISIYLLQLFSWSPKTVINVYMRLIRKNNA